MTKMTPRAAPVPVARLTGGALALLVVGSLAGCGSSSADAPAAGSPNTGVASPSMSTSPASATASTTSTPSSSSAVGRVLRIAVQGKKVTPAPSTVDLAVGETLTLSITSDHDDELHVHGFEVEAALESGRPTSVIVTGKEPGVYEVETHEDGLRLLKIAVR